VPTFRRIKKLVQKLKKIIFHYIFRATHNLFMLVNGQLKTATVIENTERQLEKVSARP
jgi:hypothetical protein